jgi:hypothetical protein
MKTSPAIDDDCTLFGMPLTGPDSGTGFFDLPTLEIPSSPSQEHASAITETRPRTSTRRNALDLECGMRRAERQDGELLNGDIRVFTKGGRHAQYDPHSRVCFTRQHKVGKSRYFMMTIRALSSSRHLQTIATLLCCPRHPLRCLIGLLWK